MYRCVPRRVPVTLLCLPAILACFACSARSLCLLVLARSACLCSLGLACRSLAWLWPLRNYSYKNLYHVQVPSQLRRIIMSSCIIIILREIFYVRLVTCGVMVGDASWNCYFRARTLVCDIERMWFRDYDTSTLQFYCCWSSAKKTSYTRPRTELQGQEGARSEVIK